MWPFKRKIKVVVPGMVDLMGGKFRIESGPRWIKVRFVEGQERAPVLEKYGIPLTYLDRGHDAYFTPISNDVDLYFLNKKDPANWAWHFYDMRNQGRFIRLIEGTESEAVQEALDEARSL
jgi:hypothetical protein